MIYAFLFFFVPKIIRHPEDSLIVEEKDTKKKKKDSSNEEKGGDAYHYIAYVPVDGEVWQLDGLYPRPVKIGRPLLLTFHYILISILS